jgi:hypothetical protein
LPDTRTRKIILYPAAPGQECRQNKRIAGRAGATIILKNFGVSDCKSGCTSHLLYFAKDSLPRFTEYREALFRPELEVPRKKVADLVSEFGLTW